MLEPNPLFSWWETPGVLQHTLVSHSSKAFRRTDSTRKQTFQEQGSSMELPAMEARPMGRKRERLAAASGLLTPRTATATLHEKTETREIRDRWNQLDCGTGERERENRRTYQYQGMERDPNQQQPPELAHGAGARGSRRRGARPWRWRAWWSGRAKKRRPTTTRVWRTEESSKTRSGGDDTDTGSGLNLRWRPVTDHGRGRRPKCGRSPDGAGKKK